MSTNKIIIATERFLNKGESFSLPDVADKTTLEKQALTETIQHLRVTLERIRSLAIKDKTISDDQGKGI